jgi:hypothetical protein
MCKRSIGALVIAGLWIFSGPTAVRASDVAAGHDAWLVPEGNATHDFAATPIPADFFEPGSDPFVDQVFFAGSGTGPCGDMLVERKAPLSLPDPLPSGDTVDIEIVALSLRSVNPITVTSNGGQDPEEWDVDVELSANPQTTGSMTVTRTHDNGGAFDSVLPVIPRFTFTEVNPPNDTRVLDFGPEGIPAVQVESDPNATWTHNVALPLVCPSSTPNFLAFGPHKDPYHPVPVESAQDHFKCWQAKDLKNPKFVKIEGLQLDDQFATESVEVKKPFLICAPASKDGSGISDRDTHQCCYKIKGGKLEPPKKVEIEDQFGTLQLEVKKGRLLCQPCTKTDLP